MAEALRNQPILTEPELRARLGEFYESLEQFNDGWYFESHETLEDLWMVTPWPERVFFQAIIQTAAAFVHFVRGEHPGIIKLLDIALERLEEFRPEKFGVDVDRLIEDVRVVRNEIADLGEDRLDEFDEKRVPMIAFSREGAG